MYILITDVVKVHNNIDDLLAYFFFPMALVISFEASLYNLHSATEIDQNPIVVSLIRHTNTTTERATNTTNFGNAVNQVVRFQLVKFTGLI